MEKKYTKQSDNSTDVKISYDTASYTYSTDWNGSYTTDGSYTIDTSALSDSNTGTISINTTSDIGFDGLSFDYEDKWPSEYRIIEMIELYPSLKIQYEKFLEIYNLVKDDYKNRSDDAVPFQIPTMVR